MEANTSQLWDKLWQDPDLNRQDALILATEQASLRWIKLKKLLSKQEGFQGKKAIEIGAGIGTYSALMAKQGARITVLDYSPKALERSKQFFDNNCLPAKFVRADALKLPTDLLESYDISLSMGLTEHFKGKSRFRINKAHLDVLKKGGIAIISVPNSYNPPYRIYKFLAEVLGTWKYGEEYPYSSKQLKGLSQQLGAQTIAIIGESFYNSFRFLLPANFLRRMFGLGTPRTLEEIKKQKPGLLDDKFSYSLTLVMKKL